VREDAGQFEHSFREMVTALNRLMAEAGDGLSDIGRVVSAIATGDLQQRVEKQYQAPSACWPRTPTAPPSS
jgi:methyl-accepting chemotaxis protein-1 (serine sensor receptor)